MDAARRARPAHRIADHPAHGVAGRDRPRTDKLLAFLQCDVGDLSGGGVDLEQRAIGPGIFLDGVEEGRALGLDARRVVRAADLRARIGGCRLRRQRERGSAEKKGKADHWLSSFDQEIAVTKTPSGFRRRASGVRGGWIEVVRIADQRDVSTRLPS